MPTINAQYLDVHGPVPGRDLPEDVTLEDRVAGVSVFKLRGSNVARTGGGTTSIYYLEHHDDSTVLRTFLEANPELVEQRDRLSLHQLIGTEGQRWLDAAREVTEAFYDAEETRRPDGSATIDEQECPLCGEVIDVALPWHLESTCPAP